MPTAIERRYTDEQREALAHASVDRGIKPVRLIVDLAARGELEHNGRKLDPFKANENTIRDLAKSLRRRRAGEVKSELANAPHRDAVEIVRRRLMNAADAMLHDFEKKVQRKPEDADPERLRQIARAAREIAALPGPTDPRPPAPGAKQDGKRDGGETKGGIAGAILKATKEASGSTAHEMTPAPGTTTPPSQHHTGEQGEGTGAAQSTHDEQDDVEGSEPGSAVRALAARLASSPGGAPIAVP